MAWSTPLTAVANAALTAAQWNLSVRDNLLETPAAKATTVGSYFVTTAANSIAERIVRTNRVDTSETTASSTFGALATPGPAATATATGVGALCFVTGDLTNNTAGGAAVMGFAVSGASTIAAADADSVRIRVSGTTEFNRASALSFVTLTAGSNTFTAQYKTNGVGTASFQQRQILVMPL